MSSDGLNVTGLESPNRKSKSVKQVFEEGSASESPDQLLFDAVTKIKTNVLGNLLQDSMFSTTTSGGFVGCTGGASSQPNLQYSCLSESSNVTNSQQSTPSKRRHDDDNSGPPDDDDGARRNKRPKWSNLTQGSSRTRRLACPYFQRNPEKHLRGACSGPGFEDMSKLK